MTVRFLKSIGRGTCFISIFECEKDVLNTIIARNGFTSINTGDREQQYRPRDEKSTVTTNFPDFSAMFDLGEAIGSRSPAITVGFLNRIGRGSRFISIFECEKMSCM